jgi:hypothetical protein
VKHLKEVEQIFGFFASPVVLTLVVKVLDYFVFLGVYLWEGVVDIVFAEGGFNVAFFVWAPSG